MFSRSLLLVLLGLVCLQSFTTAQSGNDPVRCCLSYQTHPIPVSHITAQKVTDPRCGNHGVIFTVENGRQVCANPDVKWVQKRMKSISQRQTQAHTTD